MAEAIGWGVAVDWLEENIDFEVAHKHVQSIASWMAGRMREIPGITVFGFPEREESIDVVSFLHVHNTSPRFGISFGCRWICREDRTSLRSTTDGGHGSRLNQSCFCLDLQYYGRG